ncbi:MAG: hypothetical protein JWN73_834 [Betaproteobacteria bacterium]|nr:hypothetical protein [Betaproteobacteria bacterium]
MKPMFALVAAAALGLPALASADTVFKWVDANGVTNYTTTPPPPSVHKVSAVNADPAVKNNVPALAGSEEASYWRERRMREAADEISYDRSRRENDDLRQQLARQQLASQYDEEQRRRGQEARMQAMYDQCTLARRIDCAYGYDYGGGYGVPVAVVRRRPYNVPGTFSLPGQPSLTNPTPGAPSIPVQPRPFQRPAVMTRLK